MFKFFSMQHESRRSFALDVFRGLALIWLIMAALQSELNGVFSVFRVSEEGGQTLSDGLFPTFLFAMGLSMAHSLEKFRSHPLIEILFHLVKRGVVLFFIGGLLNLFLFWHSRGDNPVDVTAIKWYQVLGPLQRMAIGYFMSAFALKFFGEKPSFVFGLIILCLYWAVISFAGNILTPNRLHSDGVVHLAHIYNMPIDLKSISVIFAQMALVLFGYAVETYLNKNGKAADTLLRLFFLGFICFASGWLLQRISVCTPVPSAPGFTLLAMGANVVLYSFLILTLPGHGMRRGGLRFIENFGKNPLLIYLAAIILAAFYVHVRIEEMVLPAYLNETLFRALTPEAGALVQGFVLVILLGGLAAFLQKRKWHLRA